MSEYVIEPFYKRNAKDLVNVLFDKRFLNDALTRESIDWLEEYFALIIQQQAESAAKCALLTAKFREKA
mgnify:CR=1 FL=1